VGAVGALAGAQLVYGAPAHASGPAGAPRPIPGGIQPFGPGTETYHVFLPGTGEPNTITDFNGFVGVGVIDGTVNGPASGLVFEVDNRFIAGEYVGLNGRHYNAAFGFLWIDIFEGSVDPANQIHDFNPGTPVDGLFWTAPIPEGSVAVSPGRGRATWMLEGFELPDFHDIVSALLHRPAVGTGVVDMTMTWTGGGQVSHVSDTAVDFTGRKVAGRRTSPSPSRQGPVR
jgi:hypothetical protein